MLRVMLPADPNIRPVTLTGQPSGSVATDSVQQPSLTVGGAHGLLSCGRMQLAAPPTLAECLGRAVLFLLAFFNPFLCLCLSSFSISFTFFIYFFEVLVAFLQAFICTILTAVFIGQAFEDGHAEEGHGHIDPAAA